MVRFQHLKKLRQELEDQYIEVCYTVSILLSSILKFIDQPRGNVCICVTCCQPGGFENGDSYCERNCKT